MDDRELWLRWAEGDEVAGNQLVERYFPSIYRFFQSKVGELAEDLAQRTFLAAVENRERFRGDGTVRAYLFGIARHQLLRHFQGRVFGRTADEVAGSSIQDLTRSPSGVVLAQQEHSLVLGALREMPLDSQILIELRYWDELKVHEIADVLGVPAGTVKSRLSRARDHLREQLDGVAAFTTEQLEEQTKTLGAALQSGG